MMNRIIIIGVDQGVMIGGRFDGWLVQLTEAGWITIRKLDEADPYAALPGVIRSSQSQELGAVGPATGPRNDQPLHDAEARRRALLSRFPSVNAERLYENVLAQPSAEARALAAEAKCDAAFAFITKLVHMQSGQGWTRAVVREAAANFLEAQGVSIAPGVDTTPEMIARAPALTQETADVGE